MTPARGGNEPFLPVIDPVSEGIERPFWSVMMPTYNCSDLMEQALRSVLDQDPGRDWMQISVVDDCSTNGRSEEIVKRLAPDRVEFFRQPTNVGLGVNWNTCIARSRGRWVHLLHQDDLVLPGFYEAMQRGVADRNDLGAAFCRYAYIDGSGEQTSVAEPERATPGILENWLELIAVGQRIECPTIVVNRETYEQLGGFDTSLYFALDWEMWVRIAAHRPVWYEPEILAYFRRHAANETSRLERAGKQLPDVIKALDRVAAHVPEHRRSELRRKAEREMRWRWHQTAELQLRNRQWAPALKTIWRAYQVEDLPTRSKAFLGYLTWAIKLGLRGSDRKETVGTSPQRSQIKTEDAPA
jgi:glycosyltransferase involved in cell wall biosynthesis